MAKKTALEAATSFVDEVSKRLPESIRAAFREAALTADSAEFIGGSVKRQDEFSRMSDELTKYRGQLDGWYADNKAKLDHAVELESELETLRASAGRGDGFSGDPDTMAEIKKLQDSLKEARADLTSVQVNGLDLMALTVELNDRHREEFGKPLKIKDLTTFASKEGLPLEIAYDRFTADARTTKQEEDIKKRLDVAREEGRTEAIRNIHDRPPYPVGNRGGGSNVFDRLSMTPEDKKASSVDAAVADFYSGGKGA